MSYNRNTANLSRIDTITEVLDELGVFYDLKNIGKVLARGSNDLNNGKETYIMRELRYKNFVVLERMSRSDDCDIDDVILSYKYSISEYETMMQDDKWEIEK